MAHEEYKVGSKSINAEISLSNLTCITAIPPSTPVQHITVVNGSGASIESPIGNDARVYVSSNQFTTLKQDLQNGKKVVVRYDATPTPTQHPTYERITNFSHYTV